MTDTMKPNGSVPGAGASEAEEREWVRDLLSRVPPCPLALPKPRTEQPSRVLKVWLGSELVEEPGMDERVRGEAYRMALRNMGLLPGGQGRMEAGSLPGGAVRPRDGVLKCGNDPVVSERYRRELEEEERERKAKSRR
jgi:hypothetical protein